MTKLLIVGGTYCFGESEFGVLISESELYYIIYRLVKVDLRDKDNLDKLWTSIQKIPHVLLDERKVVLITKTTHVMIHSIYVVNSRHFQEYFIKYKMGMTDVFRIGYKIKKDGLDDDYVKLLDSEFPFCCYGTNLLFDNWEMLSEEIKNPANVFVNNSYDFHNFKIIVSNAIQEALKCYKRTDGQFIRVTISLVNPKLILKLLEKIKVVPKNKINGEAKYKHKKEMSSYRVQQTTSRSYDIEILVNQVEKLICLFGEDFYKYPLQDKFFEGLVTANHQMASISHENSNITFHYDLLTQSLVVKAQVVIVSLHSANSNIVMDIKKIIETCEEELLHKEFFDPLVNQTMKVVSVQQKEILISGGRSRSHTYDSQPSISCIVANSELIKLEPSIIDRKSVV